MYHGMIFKIFNSLDGTGHKVLRIGSDLEVPGYRS